MEGTHRLLKQNFSKNGWNFIAGEDPIEAAVASSYDDVKNRIPFDMVQKIPNDRIIIATSSDIGNNKIYTGTLKNADEKLRQMKIELGSPRKLETIEINFGKEVLEYVRMRYLVAEKRVKLF